MKTGRSSRLLELNKKGENRKESEAMGRCERVVSTRALKDIHDHSPGAPPQ